MASTPKGNKTTISNETGILPPLPRWPSGNLIIFGSRQWDVLGETLAQLHADHNVIISVIGQFANSLESVIMSTLADLNAQLDAISASEAAEAQTLASLGSALTTIITDLQNLPPVGVLTQAELDDVVQKATDAATASATNAAQAVSEASQASGAVPPTP